MNVKCIAISYRCFKKLYPNEMISQFNIVKEKKNSEYRSTHGEVENSRGVRFDSRPNKTSGEYSPVGRGR